MPVIKISEEGLELLDFVPEIPCGNPDCDRDATHMFRCREHRAAYEPICGPCLDELRELLAATVGVQCDACGARGRCFDDVAEICPL